MKTITRSAYRNEKRITIRFDIDEPRVVSYLGVPVQHTHDGMPNDLETYLDNLLDIFEDGDNAFEECGPELDAGVEVLAQGGFKITRKARIVMTREDAAEMAAWLWDNGWRMCDAEKIREVLPMADDNNALVMAELEGLAAKEAENDDIERQERSEQMWRIARSVTDMVRPYAKGIEIGYRNETQESVNEYSEWGRQYLGIVPGCEYFIISRVGDGLLYAVNVTADSALTAAEELMHKIAAKF